MFRWWCGWSLAAALVLAAPVFAGDWAQWRGPHFNGSSDETDLPADFDAVRWSAPMPGPGAATPVVVADRVFVSSYDSGSRQVVAICLDRLDGNIIWQKKMGLVDAGAHPNMENHRAASSPVADLKSRRVYFLTGEGVMRGYDFDGNRKWERRFQEDYGSFEFLWGYGSSPLLHGGKLYVPVLQRSEDVQGKHDETRDSYLLILDVNNGKTIHRYVRPSDAVKESKEAYSTPIPRQVGKRTEILILGGDYITGHDPATGHELWRHGEWNPRKIHHWRMVPSPVAYENLVYAPAPKGQPLFAIKVAGDRAAQAWQMDRNTTDVPTPLIYEGRMYVLCGGKKVLTCLDPISGNEIWSGELPAHRYFRASATAGDGKIYLINAEGEAFIVAAGGRKFRILAQASLGGYPARASIALAHGNAFIRTAERLVCVGNLKSDQ